MEKLSKYCVCDQVKTKAVINGKTENNKSNRFVFLWDVYEKHGWALSLAFSVFIVSHHVLKNTDWYFGLKIFQTGWMNELTMNYFLPWIGVSISASAAFITAVTSSVCGLLLCCSATADPGVKIPKQIIVSVRFSSRGVPLDFMVVKVIAFSIPPQPHFLIIRVLPITSLQPFHTPTIFCFTGLIKDKIYHAEDLWSNVIINLFTDGSWQYILDRHLNV